MAKQSNKVVQKVDLTQIPRRKTIPYRFSDKHIEYIRRCQFCTFNFLEGAVRSGKTVDNIFAFAHELMTTPDRIHLATGSTMGNAKLNIGDANGFGLEWIFRGQCHWGKYHNLDALIVKGPSTNFRSKVVIFAGAGNQYSYQKIRGNSYGMWIATEINLHHDNSIKEAFNRQLAAKRRKIFWDLNPCHPKAKIYTDYIDKYAELDKAGKLLGGYNYQHMTIFDNINITKERIDEIVSQYDPGSIWYIRDILGKRSIAEGLVYPKFAAIASSENPYLMITVQQARQMCDSGQTLQIVIGVDFGGTSSGHAFVCTTSTIGNEKLLALSSELHKDPDIDPEALGELLVSFVMRMIQTYGYVTQVYCDSAEPVLIRGIRKALAQHALGNIPVSYALKTRINDRIFTMTSLTAQDRFLYTTDCETLVDALRTATWNPKRIEVMERLDDGTSDIDSLDAFEYTYERDIRYYVSEQAMRDYHDGNGQVVQE